LQLPTKYIFIAIAPNHIFNFENIIKNDGAIQQTILLNPGNYNYNPHFWSKVIIGNLNLNYKASKLVQKVNFQRHKLLGYRSFVKEASSYLNGQTITCNYYYCNLDDILSNHFFYYLNELYTTVNNYVVEDGILNYYFPEIKKTKLNSKKFLVRKILGLKFNPQLTHPTGIDLSQVRGQYVRLPKKSIYPEKAKQLPFSALSYEPKLDTVLIIGQDIMHNNQKGPDYYNKRLDELIRRIEDKHKQAKIIYKPHRNGDFSIAVNKLKKVFPDYKLFQEITPIEECITVIKPEHIYSFESSAMLNLKIAITNRNVSIRVLPYGNNNEDLLKIFADLGIIILQ